MSCTIPPGRAAYLLKSAAIHALRESAAQIQEALKAAEACETPEGVRASLRSAERAAERLANEAKAWRSGR